MVHNHWSTSTRFGSFLLLMAAALLVSAPVWAQGGGGGEIETAGNNLSYPVILAGGASLPFREPPAGTDYSLLGTYWYGWIDPATGLQVACDPAVLGCPPEGVEISRIYLQKDPLSVWQAGHVASGVPVPAAYFDWSDDIESTLWSDSSVVRVETVPFAYAPGMLGFQMWWASGKGVDEVWGARASGTDPPVPGEYPFSPSYATVYSTNAWLTLQKLEAGGGSLVAPPDTSGYVWNASTHQWDNAAAQTVRVELCSAEINVGGKVIYGFNWMLKRQLMVAGEAKDGWWRLTFSTSENTILITEGTVLTPPPPAVPPAEQSFFAKVDPVNNVTYIDLYITAARGGGGGKKG